MTHRPPPVPPASRNRKGPKDQGKSAVATRHGPHPEEVVNLHEHGTTANIQQNLTNQGQNQDR